ncbi:MAG: hypothetical protein AAB453_00485 [Patescibacteria group bacterium]
MKEKLLELKDVHVHYGGVKALDGASVDFSGAGGTFSIDAKSDAVKQIIIKTIKDGKFVKYEE